MSVRVTWTFQMVPGSTREYVSVGKYSLSLSGRELMRECVRLQKVDHAGYTRSIIARNPRRYDEYGDPLEAEEIDAYADAIAASENPYGDIKLECKHA